ncbi:PAS domain S-box protein [Hymenobacter setariae]|uniref:Sensory/regulatory protein RpfC n=1 Tax=Hymenobacter setariae TaxID=2594794 RepID=A0A558C4E9_9BACT|nr:PAS domain S-box protein [Hymenobacter setariae]TVT43577.1 PAS domain S-box protein [Hymenobacter setariae]
MLSEASDEDLRHALRERDAEIATLRRQLAVAHLTATSSHLGDLPNFVAQMQDLFVGVITTDTQGHLTWANSLFQARYKLPLASLLGQPLETILGTTPLNEATQLVIKMGLAGSLAFQFDIPDPSPTHTGGWLRVRMQPLRLPAPAPLLFVGMLEDISEEKRAQLALAESLQRYRELAEQVPGVLFRWRKNPDGSFTSLYASPKMHELFGVTPGETTSLLPLIHPEDRSRYIASIAAATADDSTEPWNFEGRLLVPGRPIIWWRGNAALSYRDAQGAVYSGFIEDITLLKQAEETDRRRELRKQLAMDGLGDGTWEYNCEKHATRLSPELLAMLGYPPAEQVDKYQGLSDGTHPDDMPQLIWRLDSYQAGRTSIFSSEHRMRCYDGSYLWVLSRGLITKRDADGEPLLITGISINISANKKASNALLAAALRLSATIDSLKRGILLVDEQQRIVQTNAAFGRIFGLDVSPERLVGLHECEVAQRVKHLFAGEQDLVEHMASTIARQKPFFDELVTLRDGRVLQCSFVPVWQEENSIGHLWKLEDITERYQAEQTLKRQEEKYRNIIDNMQLGLVEMDLDYRVLYANRSYCQMIGYSPEELLGQQLHPLILSLPEVDALRDKFADRRRGISGSYELEVTTKQGERRWVFVGAAPMLNENKEPMGTIGINLDITHQKHLERNLREAKLQAENSARAKELFLANMSHEIRTPMNAILGMSQLLAQTMLAPRQSNYLHAISTSAQNLLVIINDILDISKLDAGKMTIERVGFNVQRLCEQVEKTMLYKAEEKGLRFVTKVSPLVPNVVLGDPHRITQILLNLASNSVKFTEKGEITVESEVAGYFNGQVIISFSVCDTGVGIDSAYLTSIFQEFSQEDTSITRKFGGTGLGLSISRSLARLMGGEIYIESEKGKGTSSHFCLFLPIGTVQDLPQPKSVAITNHQELRGKRVLLVEDNEYNRLLARTFLTNANLEVTEAENGELAVACVREQEFDLILMDVQMPVMDGFEATRHLRQELELKTPIIALTASAINGEKQKCLAAGMNDYLTKPFFEDELLQLVHAWVLRPLTTPDAPVEAVAPPPSPEPNQALYKLDILMNTARGNQKFVESMLKTFIDSTYNALRDLNRALEVGNLAGLQATAHKLRPSLVHLQIQPVVGLIDQLENWEGAFKYDDLQPLVEQSNHLLRQVLANMTTELELRRQSATE